MTPQKTNSLKFYDKIKMISSHFKIEFAFRVKKINVN